MGKRKYALIIGGTSGLGHELGKLLQEKYSVLTTGRHDIQKNLPFEHFDLTAPMIGKMFERVLERFNRLDLLVYAAGFHQEGMIDELGDARIEEMIRVQLTAPSILLSKILKKWAVLPGFVGITSTSEWVPRLREPVYAATKRGFAALAESVSLDPRVKKTLVVAPSGMNTNFWRDKPSIAEKLLDPRWVAEETLRLLEERPYAYRHAKILRDPPRVLIDETRI